MLNSKWIISLILIVGILVIGDYNHAESQGDVTLTASPSSQIQGESPTPTPSPAPPTETPTATATPGPYEHTIQQGETLGYIIQLPPYSYTDFGVIDEIVRINSNIPNADTLPGAGSVILIPRKTATPTPVGLELTATSDAELNVETQHGVTLPIDTIIGCHMVDEGETIIGIMERYETTLEILSQLNPEIQFIRCNFELRAGGEECVVNIQPGQCVNIPLPTPTPTVSPTPSGNETPTPTPTYIAPLPVFPPDGAVAQPGVFRLHWVSAGVLRDNEVYLIEVTDTTNGAVSRQVTRETSLLLPESMIPTDGQMHIINWTVSVASANETGVYRTVSATPIIRTFQWQSR